MAVITYEDSPVLRVDHPLSRAEIVDERIAAAVAVKRRDRFRNAELGVRSGFEMFAHCADVTLHRLQNPQQLGKPSLHFVECRITSLKETKKTNHRR